MSPAAAHLRQAGLAPFPTAVARLMAEAAAGPASPYAAYLAVLPPDHDCLLAWDPDQLNWLSGTSLEGADDPAAARRLYDDVVEPVIRGAPTLWPPEACGYDRFVWAAGMVLSRAFHLRNDCVVAGGAAEGEGFGGGRGTRRRRRLLEHRPAAHSQRPPTHSAPNPLPTRRPLQVTPSCTWSRWPTWSTTAHARRTGARRWRARPRPWPWPRARPSRWAGFSP